MSDSYFGQQGTFDDTSEYNVRDFHIRQRLGEVRTCLPVRVVAVHGGGTGGPAPTVDVLPLVNQIDGQGNVTKHGTIHGLSTTRVHSAQGSVVCDPVAGDVGLAVFADRDVSAVRANGGAQSNPGSYRRHNLADGFYVGSTIAGTPKQWVQFTADGINIQDKSGNKITTSSAGININGVLITPAGEIRAPQDVTAGYGGGDAVDLQNHTHGGGPPPDPGS